LETVSKYLAEYVQYAIQKNDWRTDLQKKTHTDLIEFLQNDTKNSYVKKVLKEELLTVLRIQNKKE